MAMTCHVVFNAWDPERPATLSPLIIDSVIRRRIGFHGLLMTDDLDMKALSGDVPGRDAAEIAAGRSEERRVGNERDSTCRSRWTPDTENKKKKTKIS